MSKGTIIDPPSDTIWAHHALRDLDAWVINSTLAILLMSTMKAHSLITISVFGPYRYNHVAHYYV